MALLLLSSWFGFGFVQDRVQDSGTQGLGLGFIVGLAQDLVFEGLGLEV